MCSVFDLCNCNNYVLDLNIFYTMSVTTIITITIIIVAIIVISIFVAQLHFARGISTLLLT